MTTIRGTEPNLTDDAPYCPTSPVYSRDSPAYEAPVVENTPAVATPSSSLPSKQQQPSKRTSVTYFIDLQAWVSLAVSIASTLCSWLYECHFRLDPSVKSVDVAPFVVLFLHVLWLKLHAIGVSAKTLKSGPPDNSFHKIPGVWNCFLSAVGNFSVEDKDYMPFISERLMWILSTTIGVFQDKGLSLAGKVDKASCVIRRLYPDVYGMEATSLLCLGKLHSNLCVNMSSVELTSDSLDECVKACLQQHYADVDYKEEVGSVLDEIDGKLSAAEIRSPSNCLLRIGVERLELTLTQVKSLPGDVATYVYNVSSSVKKPADEGELKFIVHEFTHGEWNDLMSMSREVCRSAPFRDSVTGTPMMLVDVSRVGDVAVMIGDVKINPLDCEYGSMIQQCVIVMCGDQGICYEGRTASRVKLSGDFDPGVRLNRAMLKFKRNS